MYAASPVLHCEIPILLKRRENVHMTEQGEEEGYQVQHWLVWNEAIMLLHGLLAASEPEPSHEPDGGKIPRECVYC